MGSLFFMMLYLTLMSLSSLPVWREDRLLFLRERANRVYGRETLNPKP
jgi:ATP-binding cassette subfamily G (WHITE) protein 2